VSVQERVRDARITSLVRWRESGWGSRTRSRSFGTRKDAVDFEREVRRRQQLGAHTPTEPSPIRLEDWLLRWWSRESMRWARSTRLQRGGVLDKWITPYLADVRLRDLGTVRVREWRVEIVEDGCPPTQANAAMSVLSAVLGSARTDGLIPANPCLDVRKVPIAITRPRALSADQVERIRAKLPTARDVALWSLMAYTGLRPGEALALTWDSVLDRILVVDAAVSTGEPRQTKTNRRRTVKVIPALMEDLVRLRPHVRSPGELVAPSKAGGPLDIRNWSRRVFRPACDQAGIRATAYDGRHTYASLLIAEGRPLPYVTAALGHASATTTLRHYVHLMDAARHGTREPMADVISRARAELADSGVRRVCATIDVRVLRAS
jgi:integrase